MLSLGLGHSRRVGKFKSNADPAHQNAYSAHRSDEQKKSPFTNHLGLFCAQNLGKLTEYASNQTLPHAKTQREWVHLADQSAVCRHRGSQFLLLLAKILMNYTSTGFRLKRTPITICANSTSQIRSTKKWQESNASGKFVVSEHDERKQPS